MKTAFIYSEKFGAFSYGPEHPMRPIRLTLTYELMEALGLADLPGAKHVEARRATEDELLYFHTPEYIKVLKEADSGLIPVGGSEHCLGFGDNPVFKGVFEWSCYSTGASIQAAELVANGEADIAFNICGGLHHALPGRASGFCYLNDAAIAIKYLTKLGKRVAYVDIDAHHGDGVEYAFYDSARVLTISIHESGQYLFPGTGDLKDTGLTGGEGFSVNLPLPPGVGDDEYIEAFEDLVPPFIEAFKPDILVTQLGVDSFADDPVTHLNLTTRSFEEIIKSFRRMKLPWVALGGGGYDLGNVCRAWTLAWAVMNGAPVPEKIPADFMEDNPGLFRSEFVRDRPGKDRPVSREASGEIKRSIAFLKEEVLPLTAKSENKDRA
jgi:acetoin utilization protein AcuC